MSNRCIVLFLLFQGTLGLAAQKPAKGERAKADSRHLLKLVNEITVTSEPARGFVDPIKCDDDGNIYLMTNVDPSVGISKFNDKGQLLTHFRAVAATDFPIQIAVYYSISNTGDLYQVAIPRDTLQRAVVVFSKDGSYKSAIKLDTPPGAEDWIPSQVSAFGSGDLLVTGLTFDTVKHVSIPFTGIFSSSGTLRKQVILSDDEHTQQMVEAGDPQVVSEDHPYSNKAVEFGEMDVASDGNIYVMRNLDPLVFYAISSGGEVVKRFTVDVGGRTESMHISGRKIALLYRQGDTRESLLETVDLDGHTIASYTPEVKDGHSVLGSALACYLDKAERFTFLGTTEEGALQFKFAEPR